MNTGYISALAALAGSAIGALASVATAWLTQRYQERLQHALAESSRREKLFAEFIELASNLFVDALTHAMSDPTKLVPLYALINRIKLFARPATVVEAEAVMTRIVKAYYSPNIDFKQEETLEHTAFDPLRNFTAACRAELSG